MTKTTRRTASGQCTIRVYGCRDLGNGCVAENQVLRVEEGFRSTAEGRAWGERAVREIPLATRYTVDRPY